MPYPDLKQGEHQIVGITVIPADIDDEGNAYPQHGADDEPQYVCQICWIPLADARQGPCAGPHIPADASSLLD